MMQRERLSFLFFSLSVTSCAPHTGALTDRDVDLPEQDDSGSGGGSKADNDELDYCDIQPILATKCVRCHGTPLENGAPMALDHAAALHEPWGSSDAPLYERVGEVVEIDFMPATWLKDVEPPVEPLTSTEKDLLLRWIDADAPFESKESECKE